MTPSGRIWISLTHQILQYPHPISDAYLKELQDNANEPPKKKEEAPQTPDIAPEPPIQPAAPEGPTVPETADKSQEDAPDAPVRFVEKKRLHWKGKTCE